MIYRALSPCHKEEGIWMYMNNRIFELRVEELAFKRDYENGGQVYLSRPMYYSEYETLDDEKKEHYKIMEIHHRNVMGKMNESTAYNIFNDPDDYVEIVLHSRYSYPIMHNHEYIELVYVYGGTCIHFLENQQFEMKEGDFCILAPNTKHALSACADDAILINIMISQRLFDDSFMKLMKRVPTLSQFLENILYGKSSSPYILYPTGNDHWMHEIIYHMLEERKEKDYLYRESVVHLVKQLFIHILRNYELSAIVFNPKKHEQDPHIVALIAYITVNAAHVTLDLVADFFGYNKSYLSQLIKKYIGKTFTAFVNELRMKKAAELLTNSDMKITDIGIEVGCYDASHFNRKFLKIYQMSPKDYRKKYQK